MKNWIRKYKTSVVALIGLLLLSLVVSIHSVWCYVCFLLFIVFVFLNMLVYRKMSYNATHLFTTIDRNYLCLVIGDDCVEAGKFEKEEKCITFLSPVPRSMECVTILVKRLYSLLDETHGELIIMKRKVEPDRKFSVFDVPYIHENTLHILGIERMKYACRMPLLFSPIGSIKLLLNVKMKGEIQRVSCPSDELIRFCESRNIKYKFYYII